MRRRKISKSYSYNSRYAPSPQSGSNTACLCPDNTYRIDCCDGSLWAQGIGRIFGDPITTETFYITDDNGNILTDDQGNRLTWK